MDKHSFGFLLVALGVLGLALFLTLSFTGSKEAKGAYDTGVGSFPNAPHDKTLAKTVIHFEKVEDES